MAARARRFRQRAIDPVQCQANRPEAKMIQLEYQEIAAGFFQQSVRPVNYVSE